MRPAIPLLLGLLLGIPGAQADGGLGPMREQAVGLMRHGGAVTAPPGTVPPVRGCRPDAVLTDIGRDEMRRWGARLRDEGLAGARVHVSRQCSAWETGTLLRLGEVRHDPALDPEAGPEALRRALLAAMEERREGGGPVLFITHRANIAALTGIELLNGEIMLLAGMAGGLNLLGRVSLD